MSDEQGVVHVDVSIGRPRQRVEILVVWQELGEPNDGAPEGPQTEQRPSDASALSPPDPATKKRP